MGKRPRTPHFITGLGDGNVHEHPHMNVQDLITKTKRTPIQHNIRSRNKALLPNHFTERPLLERDAFSNSGDGVPHPASRGGPWQYTAMGFLAVMGILVAIFLHLITDSSPERKHYRRRRVAPASRKKKIDAWSDDEQSDQAYRADNEEVQAGQIYPLSPRYGNHVPPEHRHRAGTLTHRSYQHPEPVGPSAYKSPSSARHQQSLERSPVPSGATPLRPNTSRDSVTPLPAPRVGLEAFQSPKPRITEGDVTPKSPWAPSLQAQLLSPVSSFNSLEKGVSDSSMERGDEELGTPRRGPSPVAPLPHTSSRLLTPGSDDVTPHRANIRPILKVPVDATTGDRLLQNPPLMSPPPPRRAEPRDGSKDNMQVFPYIPVLEKPEGLGGRPPPPPESMSLEELHLVKMESGAPWEVATESQFAAYPGRIRHPQNEERDELTQLRSDKHARRIQRRSEPSDKADSSNDPRKNIVHKRQNITYCTDAESSLLSSVDFSEVTLEAVIGGGGFGEVWKGSWRSTPVAVKVLTGSAQRENVSKAILEEFAAEINMLKGMRHPNICLYMGACFDPPNRCIITELAANGSLWDALRLPLSPPFQATDGITHLGWPVVLYSRPGGLPTSYVSRPPPVVPKGTWPWGLVKRVACGAARGMTYLHSGKPPVLHRDLKSANILLDESYTAKVCDFGLSRIKAQERSMTGNCGTVQWMAPEVLANQPYAEPADVFSFGIIMWETLTGECPYDGMSAIQCALAVLNRDLRPPIPEWCPPSLSALIRSCLDKDPSKRPTFAQILLALDAMP